MIRKDYMKTLISSKHFICLLTKVIACFFLYLAATVYLGLNIEFKYFIWRVKSITNDEH